MAFQPAPGIVGTTIQGRMDGQLTILDLNWFASGAIDAGTVSNLLAGMHTWVTAELAPLLSRDWFSTRIVASDLTTNTGLSIEENVVEVGGVDQEAAPNNVAACVSLRTDQRGRSGRGRNFVPGIPNTLITLNTLDPTFMSDLISAYVSLVGAGSFVAGWQLVILSRFTGGVARANGIGIPVTGITMVGNSVRSMRSREIGHGA